MEPSTPNPLLNKKFILVQVMLLVASSAVGVVVGRSSSFGQNRSIDASASISLGTPAQNTNSPISGSYELHSLPGVISAIKENTIVFHEEGSSIQKTAFITKETKIVKVIMKELKVFELEMADFLKKQEGVPQQNKIMLPPERYVYEIVNASEMAVGDIVTVNSIENMNIQQNFSASEIQFHSPISKILKK